MYERLTEKGKEYNQSLSQMREHAKRFDDKGRKLFTPSINRDGRTSAPSGKKMITSLEGVWYHMCHVSCTRFEGNETEPVISASESNQTSERSKGQAQSAAADEFLYQDALDREERFRLREIELQQAAAAEASAKKMNDISLHLLRRKSVRLKDVPLN